MERHTMGVLALISVIVLGILASGCISPPDTPSDQSVSSTGEVTPVPSVTAGPASDSVAEANNRFAFDMYSRLRNDPEHAGGNIFFSPFSISSALAITYEGARGETADEIRSVFHFPGDDATLREGYYEIIAGLNREDTAYSLRTANALWAEKTYQFLPGYISTAGRYYSAKTTNLDFINRPEDSRVTINRWVEEKTEDRIKDMLPEGSIGPLTRLVITNAIYFKGTWVKQFDKDKTQEEDFRVGPDETVRVRMMQRTDENAVYRYTETDTLQVLGMPYEHESGKALSMLVILPRNGGLGAAEAAFDSRNLSQLQQSLTSRRVMVYFPRFTFETKYFLKDSLATMGMLTAFTGAADFSGMDGAGDLFIDEVVHQAFVDVNEEGTEASAATAVGMKLAAAAPEDQVPVFRADHPFIFLIQDDETGNILFMGRVVNPAGN